MTLVLAAVAAAYPPNTASNPVPGAQVSLASVSNGCGGGNWAALVHFQNYLGDTSSFKNSNINPLATSYTVSFREACNLHDAGYSGAVVEDPINGGWVDYLAWTQKEVDEKFLADMRKLCAEQIPASATVALANCESTGGHFSLGAESRYNFVRHEGHNFFIRRPDLDGRWEASGGGPAWTLDAIEHQVTIDYKGGKGHEGLVGHAEALIKGEGNGFHIDGPLVVTEAGTVVHATLQMKLTSPSELSVQVCNPACSPANAFTLTKLKG